MFSIRVLMFAAGMARRFGADKRFVELRGEPLWRHSLHRLVDAGYPITMVVRPGERSLFQSQVPDGVCLHEAARASEGLGGAIASTITQVDADGVLIALGDMPWLSPATVRRIGESLSSHAIVAPVVDNIPAHPVGFQRSLFRELAQLQGEQGAQPLLIKHADSVFRVAITDEGAIRDVDTPADLTDPPNRRDDQV